jgi:hypothetical protein
VPKKTTLKEVEGFKVSAEGLTKDEVIALEVNTSPFWFVIIIICVGVIFFCVCFKMAFKHYQKTTK